MINEDRIKLFKTTELAFCFDFYSEFNRKQLTSKMIKNLNLQDISYSDKYMAPNTLKNLIRLVRFDEGGSKMTQIQVNFMPYFEALNVAYKIFDIIDNYGFTNNKCKLTVSLKLNTRALGVPKISEINTIKLLSSIDNCNTVQKMYKNSHEKLYLNSLMYIYPKDIRLSKDADANYFANYRNFNCPNSKKFNLISDDIKYDIITVRYGIKREYQKQKNSFTAFVNQLIQSVYMVLLNNNALNQDEHNKISRVMDLQNNVLRNIWTYDMVSHNLPNIEILVDLKSDYTLINTYYQSKIRQKLFELISYCSLESCTINYDTTRDSIQIRDANITEGNRISGIEFFYSHISGDFYNCVFYECEISNSEIHDSEIMYGNDILNSKVYNSSFHGVGIMMDESFVRNPEDKLIEADIQRSVIMGPLNYSSNMDEESELLK